MKLLTILSIAFALTVSAASAQIPFGVLTEVDGVDLIAMPFPLDPGFPLPGAPPPELRSFGLIVSILNEDPMITEYAVYAALTTAEGTVYLLQESVVAGEAGTFSPVALSHLGDERVVSCTMTIIASRRPTQLSRYYLLSQTQPKQLIQL